MKKITELTPDNLNANRGTHLGKALLDKSFNQFKAGRSILIDKNDRIIAGNKSVKSAMESGIEDVIIVETTGDEIIAVRRTDLDLNSKEGREMALADNSTAALNIDWDDLALQVIADKWEVGSDWGVEIPSWDEEEDFEPNLNHTQSNRLTTERDISNAQEGIDRTIERSQEQSLIEVTCPDCGYLFKIRDFDL